MNAKIVRRLTGDQKKLVENNLPLVRWIVAKMHRFAVQSLGGYAEAISCGNLHLCHAAILFDPSRGVQFGTYATVVIRSRLYDDVRAAGKKSDRLRFVGDMAKRTECEKEGHPELTDFRLDRDDILANLTPYAKEIFQMLSDGWTTSEIAELRGVTRSAVHGSYRKWLKRIRHKGGIP